METVLEIVEEEETHLVNTMVIVEEIAEEEETQLVNTMETVQEIDEDEEPRYGFGFGVPRYPTDILTMETRLDIVEDEETSKLVNTLKSTLRTLPPLCTEACMYRVPYDLRLVNEEAYTPMLVSIGPFHHGKGSLQEMDVQKRRYLDDFLKGRPDLDLEYYVKKLKEYEKRARNCYAENIMLSSNGFIEMMLLDGCFIVEFLVKFCYAQLRNKDDPIFKSDAMINGIIRDMTLLENQLPFFILENLFNLIVEPVLPRGMSILELAINTMSVFMTTREEWIRLDATTYQAKHMVDLCLQYYTPTGTKLSPKTEGGIFRIPNASRLHESGVKFTRSGVKCLLDVKFTNGNLDIPSVMFEDNTESFLRNLTAYEQCDYNSPRFFSEYIHLMDCLIDTPNDVELLTKAGIINNLLGDNAEVAQIVNKLGTALHGKSDFYLRPLFEDVNDYCNRPWHAWRAKLKMDYFNTPWTIVSVVAAVILLILAFIQSVCSILQLKG